MVTSDIAIDPLGAAHTPDLAAPWAVILLLVSLPVLFNAIALFPEVRHSTPTNNDQVFHYLFIERADQAISAGDSPFDHWLPELELGFPQFLYYQNLPHLLIVGLYRLLLKQVSLIRLLNLVRYLLLVSFPLTVYWSMRRMEFSTIAAAVGATISPMLSSAVSYGFDYHSYIWGGLGMFPQLCAMHLLFAATACVRRVIEHQRGFAAAIIASSGLVLSDLLYGYILGIAVSVLWLLSILKAPAKTGLRETALRTVRSTKRLALVAAPAALITGYQAVPFFAQIQYLNLALPPLARIHGASNAGYRTAPFGLKIHYLYLILHSTLKQLVTLPEGHFFDNNRLPAITLIVAIGIFYGLTTRREEAKLALTMLAAFLLLFVPNPLGLALATLMPMARLVPFSRLIAGVDFGAILIAGLGGEWIWQRCGTRSSAFRLVPIILLLGFYIPLMSERWSFYRASAAWMDATDRALQDDQDLPQIMSALSKGSPGGRVYAGTRGNWGEWMRLGAIHLYDLLPIEMFATVMPWQTLSLNAPLLWQLNIPSPEICRLFNIRYIVAPPNLNVPDSYRATLTTSRYTLYEVDSGGSMQLGRVVRVIPMESSRELFQFNRTWLASQDPPQGKFTAFLSSREQSDPELATLLDPGSPEEGSRHPGFITDEVVTPDSLSARVSAGSDSVLVLKITYHPNWHVAVDGHEQRTFMVSPSFIGTLIKPGLHNVNANYRSSNLKKMLLVLSCFCLAATIAGWILGFERWLLDRFVV